MSKYYFTDKQKEVDKIIHNTFGIQTIMEYPIGEYALDIFCPELNWGIEIIGPQHYKKALKKREEKLLLYGLNGITYIPADLDYSAIVSLLNELFRGQK